MYKWIQNGQTSEIQKLAHTPADWQGVCVRLRVTDAVLKKSTSLPRELSAIADLNAHRYLSAASSFWTAVAAVTKQVHTFLFFRNKPKSLSRALSDHLNAYSAGFLQKRDTSRESTSTQSYLRIILQNGGVGLTYEIIATVNDYFLFLLFLVSGVVGGKYSAELFLFLIFSTINI